MLSDQVATSPSNQLRKLPNKKRLVDVSQTYWAQEQDIVESDVGLATRQDLLQRHGNFSLAYSTAVQPRLHYFGDDRGYIAFRKRWGLTFVLGDMVASENRYPHLLDEFLARHHRVTFCQITRPLATLLSQRRYSINEMGVDTTLDLDDYTFDGKHKEWLRYASNWTTRRDYQVLEQSFDEVGPDVVESISESWRATRTVKHKEVRFLNRPIVLEDEPDVRKFFLYSPDKKIVAYIFLDPIYQDKEILGYVTVIKRRSPDSPIYAEPAIMKHIIETLQRENVSKLNLGWSPLAWIEDDEFRKNWVTHHAFRLGFRARWLNRYFYNVLGHAQYKRRFRGREEKVYFASKAKINTFRIMALLGLCGIA